MDNDGYIEDFPNLRSKIQVILGAFFCGTWVAMLLRSSGEFMAFMKHIWISTYVYSKLS